MNMDKYSMLIHYERLHNHNKAKHNKTVRIFLGIYCKRDSKEQQIVYLGEDIPDKEWQGLSNNASSSIGITM